MKPEQIDKVMLIDDNVTDRFIHKKLLDIYKIGKSVLEFSSGRSALEYFREHKKSYDDLPDIVLLDVLMPEMNGFDFLIHLENLEDELAKKSLIYMLSSTDDESDLRKAKNMAIVQRMLRKPFSPEALINAISEL